MKTAHEIHIEVLYVICPHCGMSQHDWLDDPRSKETVCEDCGETYKVAANPEIVIE